MHSKQALFSSLALAGCSGKGTDDGGRCTASGLCGHGVGGLSGTLAEEQAKNRACTDCSTAGGRRGSALMLLAAGSAALVRRRGRASRQHGRAAEHTALVRSDS